MSDNTKGPATEILINTLKSFTILFLASLAFVSVITIFHLIGSLTMNDFPIIQVIKDNFSLLIPLGIVSMLLSPLLGWAGYKFIKKRFLKLLALGVLGNWIAIISIMLVWSNFSVNNEDIGSFLFLSVWALVAYSFFSIPILTLSIFIIERWTRKISGTGTKQ